MVDGDWDADQTLDTTGRQEEWLSLFLFAAAPCETVCVSLFAFLLSLFSRVVYVWSWKKKERKEQDAGAGLHVAGQTSKSESEREGVRGTAAAASPRSYQQAAVPSSLSFFCVGGGNCCCRCRCCCRGTREESGIVSLVPRASSCTVLLPHHPSTSFISFSSLPFAPLFWHRSFSSIFRCRALSLSISLSTSYSTLFFVVVANITFMKKKRETGKAEILIIFCPSRTE